jgi:glycosyltransferase involved in cell wall biosynthesis
MKIVFVNDLIYAYATGAPSAVGGAERQQWLMARALAKAGWQVAVGVRQPLGLNEKSRIEEVEFVGIGQKRFLWSWYRFLASERPDWWYWRCASHLLGIAVILAKLTRVRMIFAAGFDSDVDVRHALFQRPRWWPLFGLGLEWSDKILVQNDKQLMRLPRRWQAKTRKVPSITPETGAVIPHAQRARYVAWVAMLRKFKRPDLLIEIAQKATDLRFVICGGTTTFTAEPGYGEAIGDLLRSLPNVEYRGQVSPEEAQRVISEAAVFLSTADEEGFPNTFLQAWGAGTPVISLRIDPDQIIERHALGKVSSTIADAIADIRGLIGSPEAREAISARAKLYVANHHSSSALVSVLENVTLGISHPNSWAKSECEVGLIRPK